MQFGASRRGRLEKLVAFLFVLVASLSLGACESVVHGVPPQHVVYADTFGRLVDPTGALRCNEERLAHQLATVSPQNASNNRWEPCFGEPTILYRKEVESVPEYFEDMFSEMNYYFESHCREGEPRRLAIIVHGGLASNPGNLRTARDLAPLIMGGAGECGQYPVFIVWQSNLWGSLVDDYFKVVNGVNHHWGPFALLMPSKLLSDIAEGVAEWPVDFVSDSGRRVERFLIPRTHPKREADENYGRLRHAYEGCAGQPWCDQIAISRGPWCHRLADGTANALRNFVFAPVKVVSLPFVEGMGTSAWDGMLRHASIVFRNEGDAKIGRTLDGWPESVCISESEGFEQGGDGAVALFFRRLREEIECSTVEWRVDLIGHSMGTIVVNEILRTFSDIDYENVVYMAGASSIEDYESSVFPYLARQLETGRPMANIWHLTLHRFAELREEYFFGLAPSGSLLVWIDDFFADPNFFRERTVGRYDNLMIALPFTPSNLKQQINVKTFGVGRRLRCTDPQGHGGFLRLGQANCGGGVATNLFWKRDFWMPDPPEQPIRRCN